jgi:hypothetical protein
MSDNTDWTLIVLASQKAQIAAEGSLQITERLQAEWGNRLTGLEGRFSALEGRITALEGRVTSVAAGQDSLHRAVMRMAGTQADQTARLTRIEQTLTDIARKLAAP